MADEPTSGMLKKKRLAEMKMAGDLLGYGLPRDQMNIQRTTPTPPWPQNNPFPFDLYNGPSAGPPVDFSYPPARRMVPANEARLNQPTTIGNFKKGGTVPKTGLYRLHAGETVVPAQSGILKKKQPGAKR